MSRLNELMRRTDPDDATDVEILDPGQATPAEAQAAFSVGERIKNNLRAMRTLWVTVAEDLYRFHELDMWRDLGYPTFEAWLADPEIQIGRRTVFGLIEVWRELVVHRGVAPHQIAEVPISNLRDTLPAVRRGFVDPDDAIADCRTLGRDDLRRKYQELSTPSGARRDPAGALPSANGTGGSGGFDAGAEPTFAVCPACGSRYEVRS